MAVAAGTSCTIGVHYVPGTGSAQSTAHVTLTDTGGGDTGPTDGGSDTSKPPKDSGPKDAGLPDTAGTVAG